MRMWSAVSLAAALVWLAGCNEQPVSLVEYDPAGSFSGLKSYRWMAESPGVTVSRPAVSPELRERVVRAVDRALTEKGFVLAPEGKVDFLVGYHMGLDGQRTDVRSMNAYYNYPPGWAWDYYRYGRDLPGKEAEQPAMVLANRGAVVVDVALAPEGRLVWRGTAYAPQAKGQPASSISQEWFDLHARDLLSRFPPAP